MDHSIIWFYIYSGPPLLQILATPLAASPGNYLYCSSSGGKNSLHQHIVRNLGIFIISLIQKYNSSRFVTTYMCMCIFLMNATACIDDILIDTVRIQNTVITEIRLYPAERPMPRASEAPFALDIVRCSKSRTTVDAKDVRSAVPRTDHQEEDTLTFQGEDGSKSDLQEEDERAVADRSPKT